MTARARLLGAIAAVLLAACNTGPSGSPGGATGAALRQTDAASSAATLPSDGTPIEPTQTDEPSHAAGPSPVEVVQAFYDWYLEGRPMADVVGRPELSPAFVQFLGGFDEPYDPFSCSAVLPASIQAVTSSLSGKTAIVSTIVSTDDVNFEAGPAVDLVVSRAGEWQLEFVGCEGG